MNYMKFRVGNMEQVTALNSHCIIFKDSFTGKIERVDITECDSDKPEFKPMLIEKKIKR